jgi:hypothetical protein
MRSSKPRVLVIALITEITISKLFESLANRHPLLDVGVNIVALAARILTLVLQPEPTD